MVLDIFQYVNGTFGSMDTCLLRFIAHCVTGLSFWCWFIGNHFLFWFIRPYVCLYTTQGNKSPSGKNIMVSSGPKSIRKAGTWSSGPVYYTIADLWKVFSYLKMSCFLSVLEREAGAFHIWGKLTLPPSCRHFPVCSFIVSILQGFALFMEGEE